jgi:hypothetical protein
MTSILSAKQRASRRPALLEMSLEAQRTKSKQRQGKKRKESGTDCLVWAPASSILVILHYLLKNNRRDFNTGCCKNQLSESPDDPPKFAWGAWLKWEDRA